MVSLRRIRIRKVEDRPMDAWLDVGLRQMREGKVRFYRVWDFLTGEWLFKVCSDGELGRVTVKAVKCPPGRVFSQLEGGLMLFQRASAGGSLYDVVSLSYVDGEGRLRRNVVESLEEVPSVIRDNFEVKPYEEATGKRAPGKGWVTLSREGDERALVTLFMLERAWPVSPVSPEVGAKTAGILALIRELEKAGLEELYREAGRRLGVERGEVDRLLALLEKEGSVERPGPGYVKAAD